MKQHIIILAVCLCNLLSAFELDILTRGSYSFTPGKIYYSETEIVNRLITGVWASKGETNGYYSIFPGKTEFIPLLFDNFTGRKVVYQKAEGDLSIEHYVNENGIICLWHLQLSQTPGGGGELGIFLPGTALKEESKVWVNQKQTGIFRSDAKNQQHLGSLRNSGNIIIDGQFKYCINIKILTPEQIHGVFVQKYHDGIRIIASYNFSKADREIQWALSLGIDKALDIPNELLAEQTDANTNKTALTEIQQKLDKNSDGLKNFELTRELFPLRIPSKHQNPKSFVMVGENIRITLQKNAPQEASYQWYLKNEVEQLIEHGTLNLDKETGKHDFVFTLQKNGCYRLEVIDSLGCKREALFAVFPPLPKQRVEDGILGATGVQDGLFELAEICGLSWHRWHCGYVDSRAKRIFPDDLLNTDHLEHGLSMDKQAGMQTLGSLMSYQDINAMDDQQFKDFVQWWSEKYLPSLVGYLKNRVYYYEVFNEPYYTFRHHTLRYVELLKTSNQCIKQIDPEIKTVGVCGPPFSMGDKFYREIFQAGGLNHMDVLSFHQYCFSDKLATNQEKLFENWILHLKKLCAEYGRPDLPIWNSESSTGLTPSLYRLPENLRRIQKSEEVLKVSQYEQAAVFSRILTIHYAYKVKYFFHLFGASSEYSCHITEFDGSPLPIAVAMAAVHRRLEGAQLTHRDSPHPRLKIYQFRKPDKWVAAIWLEQIRQNEQASVHLPESIIQPVIYDFMGNPVQANIGDLQVGAEPIFIEFTGETLPGEKWHAVVLENSGSEGSNLPSGVQLAKDQDWASYYYQISLRNIANRSLVDEIAGDQAGGFTDEGINDLRNLPLGNIKVKDIPYNIITAEENNGHSILVMNGFERPYFPASVTLPLPELPRLAKIHLLHLCTYAYQHPPEKPVYRLEIIYDDNSSEIFPMFLNRDIADWFRTSPANVDVAMICQNALREVAIFHKEITIGNSRGAMTRVKELRFTTENGGAIPVILAITGVVSN
ncbi:MAG: hypothetical protein WCT05_03150 [Lentisphaeria bacterium]